MPDFALNRIRILKTGLAGVDRYLDMSIPENVLYFEKLANPGMHLKLRRVKDYAGAPFRIEVYAPDDRFLGRVTVGKNETAARLMDAGKTITVFVDEILGTLVQTSGTEDPRLPLILYMDVYIPEEKEI